MLQQAYIFKQYRRILYLQISTIKFSSIQAIEVITSVAERTRMKYFNLLAICASLLLLKLEVGHGSTSKSKGDIKFFL